MSVSQSPQNAVEPIPDISILIVSWNVRDLLLDCLAAIPEAVGDTFSYEVIVVDNASRDDTVAAIQSAFPRTRIIANSQNRGFTGGNNQALAKARGNYLFLLNPDTKPTAGAIAELVQFLQEHPQVGIVGPHLQYGDGSHQPSRRRFPTLLTLFTESTIVQEYLPWLPWFRTYSMLDQPHDQPQLVDWIVGAAMMVRRQVYEQIGGLDESFFMYSDELDWCFRAQAAGWQVAYDPHALIIHYEGKSSEQVVSSRHIRFFRGRVLYTRKYFGSIWAEILRWWLLMTFGVQWLREGGKWLLGHKRPLRRERMVAYCQVLRSRLRP
ncbi:MAG: glycosyltransferase family 2 protein [Chloroflexi bacterium]|nr:glycosyltransferase family 2 protein [Chloroflexota bacterium]